MQDPKQKHGNFSWNELSTTDVDAAKSFYSAMFGWEYEQVAPGGMPYNIVRKDGVEVAGIMSLPDEAGDMPPMWGGYITVDDVDAAAAQLLKLQGRILMEPMEIPDIGRFCLAQDPQGAIFSMITYS